MGCCVSTNRGSPTEAQLHQKPVIESRAAPPSPEVETVKEVLSETPKPKAPVFMISKPQEEENEEEKKTQQFEELPAIVKIQEKGSLGFRNVEKTEPKPPVVVIEESASEDVSEICSVSFSESVSTLTERRCDDDEEVRQQKVFRSPVARPGSSRNRVVGRSPTRKLDQSPGRRNGVVVSSGGNAGPSSVRRGTRPDSPRKDPGESSGRRSRSPAVNRSVMGRSPSGKRSNQSPVKVRRDSPQCGNSKKEEPRQQLKLLHGSTATATMEGKWPSCSSSTTANESLENPVVSLECFIFL